MAGCLLTAQVVGGGLVRGQADWLAVRSQSRSWKGVMLEVRLTGWLFMHSPGRCGSNISGRLTVQLKPKSSELGSCNASYSVIRSFRTE